MSDASKKVKFIRAWFSSEAVKLSFSDQLKLARIWVDICTKDEEYEMASAVQEEKEKLIQERIKQKKRDRTLMEKLGFSLKRNKKQLLRLLKGREN